MNKLFTYLSKKSLSIDNGSTLDRLWTDHGPMKSRKLVALLFCLLFVGVGQMWGAYSASFARISSVSELSAGDSVLVVLQDAKTPTSGYAVQNNSTNYSAVTITTASNTITCTNAKCVWKVGKSSSNWYFQKGSQYIAWTSSTTLTATGTTSNTYTWTIADLSGFSGYMRIKNTGTGTRDIGWSGSKFAAYANSNYVNQMATSPAVALKQYDGAISIYKKQTGYAITFKETGGSNNGSGLAAANATSLTISTAPTPATGKVVEGYYAENTLTTKVANADGSWAANNIAGWVTSGKYTKGSAADLYIKWTDLVTTVTLDKGTDGTTDGTATITYNATSFTSITDATKTGYHLSGYYTTAGGGSKVINADGSLVASQSGWTSMGKWIKEATEATLYAHWTIDDYTVSWSVNGESWTTGVSSSNNHANYKSKITSMPTDPTSSNCDNSKVFVGWTKSSSYSSATTPPSDLFTTVAGSPTITGNTTFYAVFATADANVTAKDTWKKISSTSQITDGMQVLLINKNSTTYYAINSSAGATSITGVGSATFTTNNNALRFAVEKGVSNYKFKTLDGKYLSTSAQSNNTTLQLDKTYDTWTISSDAGSETGTFNLVNSIALEYYSSTLKLYGWSDSYKQYFRFVICIPAYTNYATSCCTELGSINGSFLWTVHIIARKPFCRACLAAL